MKKLYKLKHFLIAVVFLSIMSYGCTPVSTIKLQTPKTGTVVSNNMPTLTWSCSNDFDKFEIWIDGQIIDTISGTQKLYVPFPLSFGKHTWEVIGFNGNNKTQSNQGHFIIEDKPLSKLPAKSHLIRNNWHVKAASEVAHTGKELSSYDINVDDWAHTSVPATVLTALVRNGIYPNPYMGMNNMLIPDSHDDFNKEYDLQKYSHLPGKNPWLTPYWYRVAFDIPKTVSGNDYWLVFNEINYKGELWLNGHKIAAPSQMIGMERTFRFNVTELINKKGKNILAVAIHPLDFPGKPEPEPLVAFGEPGENMGDGMISKNYTKWDAIGWDWQPPVRDRDMGITEDVFLFATDELEFDNLYITSEIPLPDTTQADLIISADLINHSSKSIDATIKAEIIFQNESIEFEQKLNLAPNQTVALYFDNKQFEQLQIQNPRLWWPVGYGQPNLYQLNMTAETSSGSTTSINTKFGIRKVETYIGAVSRVFKINGKEIYCKGGNWVLDMMLNWTASRYLEEILLTKNSGLNILRVWGPTGAPPKAFYEAADEHGILLWQDFLNDFWGTFKNTPGFTPNGDLFEKTTIGIVNKYRNHPSLVIWCGGNEGVNPRERLITKNILPKNDGRDSKHYLTQSDGDGLHGGGPYHTIKPQNYFTHDKLRGFSSEIGPSGMPVRESMVKFITDLGENYPEGKLPVNAQWAYHDGTDRGSDDRKFSHYDNLVRNCYGQPESLADYFEKSQLLNYDVYRASIESINRYLWHNSSGIALWKSNSSWPSITWQIYDWYLQAHAGYYGVKKASEMIHVQLNRDNMDIVMLNATHQTIDGVTVSAKAFDHQLKLISEEQQLINLQANGVTPTILEITDPKQLKLVLLEAFNEQGKLLSKNLYWLHPTDDYTGLRELKATKLSTSINKSEDNERSTYDLTLSNNGEGIAFMIEIALTGTKSGVEILPSYYSDNYITLFPGESKTIIIETAKVNQPNETSIRIKPYNSEPIILSNL